MNAIDRSRVALVIPAFNEAATILEVVSAVQAYGQPIVVDDGSADATGQLAASGGALVVKHSANRGYDHALESGLVRAIADGYDFAITLDADGQHRPKLVEEILEKLATGPDVVIGVRDRRQRTSESVFSFVSKILWGISDPLCGMKGYRLESLRAVGSGIVSYQSVGTELAIRAARSRWKIAQLPITTLPRTGSSRFGGGLRANWKIFRALAFGIFLAERFTAPEDRSR